MMTPEQALATFRALADAHLSERWKLRRIEQYWRGEQAHPAVPQGMPQELRQLAAMSRVNVMRIVVSSVAQTMYVDGYRRARDEEDAEAWRIWQVNQMDARQSAVHRAALAYGVAYLSVLPGDPAPRFRIYSPLRMLAIYGDPSDMWPMMAIAYDGAVQTPGDMRSTVTRWRLIDDEAVYPFIARGSNGVDSPEPAGDPVPHGAGVCPVVRFVNLHDADGRYEGEVEPLIQLQDQVDLTTFGLMVAQHYGAFRQRAIIGWVAESEEQALRASAQRLWQFDDPDVKLFEFGQTDLGGYIESREASLRHIATLSQTPVHELIGAMVNLSAEALVAAEAGQRRKVVERQMSFGESWEQALELAGAMAGLEVDPEAEVRWRDTESRALSQTVDALGKMAQMLGVPAVELWERIPGVSQQDVQRWRRAWEQGDVLAQWRAELEQQAAGMAELG